MRDSQHDRDESTRPERFATGRYGRGWGRPDEQVRDDIRSRMTGHSYLDASDVRVAVEDGDVTLTGTASDDRARDLAAEIAQGVSGVRAVRNELEIGLRPARRERIENPEDEVA